MPSSFPISAPISASPRLRVEAVDLPLSHPTRPAPHALIISNLRVEAVNLPLSHPTRPTPHALIISNLRADLRVPPPPRLRFEAVTLPFSPHTHTTHSDTS